MKPYRDSDGLTLYHGDALVVMPTLPDASVDLIVADPPYHRAKMTETWDRQWATDADYLAWIGALCREWKRLLKPNGSLYCFASPRMSAAVEMEVGKAFNVLNQVVWLKPDGAGAEKGARGGLTRSYIDRTERIVFAECLASDGPSDKRRGPIGQRIHDARVAAGRTTTEVAAVANRSGNPTGLCSLWENPFTHGGCIPSAEQYIKVMSFLGAHASGEYDGLLTEHEQLKAEFESIRRPFSVTGNVPYTDVWDFPTVQDYPGKHPCEKPKAMMEHIIRASSRKGAVVLDPTCGSGVTLDAARECGRQAIGIEVSEDWCRRVVRRLSQGILAFGD